MGGPMGFAIMSTYICILISGIVPSLLYHHLCPCAHGEQMKQVSKEYCRELDDVKVSMKLGLLLHTAFWVAGPCLEVHAQQNLNSHHGPIIEKTMQFLKNILV